MTAREKDYAKFFTDAKQASLIMPEGWGVYGCSSVWEWYLLQQDTIFWLAK